MDQVTVVPLTIRVESSPHITRPPHRISDSVERTPFRRDFYVEHNPTVPLSFDIQATLIMLAYVLLTIAALVSMFRTHHDRVGSKFWWSALIIVLPLIGPAVWFLLGAPPLRRRTKLQ